MQTSEISPVLDNVNDEYYHDCCTDVGYHSGTMTVLDADNLTDSIGREAPYSSSNVKTSMTRVEDAMPDDD